MASAYGPNGNSVVASLVNSVNITGGTVLSAFDDFENGFTVTFRHDTTGCGGPDSGIFVEIKDFIPWKYMSCRFRLLGTAACWSFMNTGGGNYGGAAGSSGTGYMLAYNESLGDRIIRTYLAQDDAQFIGHDKVYACDNESSNFMRYNGDQYKTFTIVRRRSVSASLAGVHHGRSCNSSGSGSITIIDQIRVW
jgi:hypothetical protein